MSHSGTFPGADFFVQSATQLTITTVRIRFTQDPLALNPAATDDGLNPALYDITGPGLNQIDVVATVPEDPQSLDLTLARPLAKGTWIVTVDATLIDSTSTRLIQGNRSATLEALIDPSLSSITGGVDTNDTAENILRKHLSPALVGKAWNALIAAFSVGDALNWENARLAFDQLFKSTASGVYLDRKAGNDGFNRPTNVGMTDETFRRLAIKVTNNKLTAEAILEVLEVFYGPQALRANVLSAFDGPFVIHEGDDLLLRFDVNQDVRVIFSQEDFSASSKASALEVAVAITRACRLAGSSAYATTYIDATTGGEKVQIFSGSLGLSSSVRVLGGIAQKKFKFPEFVPAIDDSSILSELGWTITNPSLGVMRFTATANPSFSFGPQLQLVQEGDYVIVTGSAFDPLNKGSFRITNVNISFSAPNFIKSFDVVYEINGVPTNGINEVVSQTTLQDVLFFRPSKQTIHTESNRTVVVSQADPGLLKIRIPATTQAVSRTVDTASYIYGHNPIAISSLTRNPDGTITIVFAQPHGLTVDNNIFVDNAYAGLTVPSVTAGTSSTIGTSEASFWQALVTNGVTAQTNYSMAKLTNGHVLITGGVLTGLAHAGTTRFTLDSTVNYSFLTTPNLGTARYDHTTTDMADGRGVVIGGWDGSTVFDSSELYTVGSPGSWAAGPIMTMPRFRHKSIRLNDGRILVVGGSDLNGDPLSTCEVLNSTGTAFTAVGSMRDARQEGHGLILLDDGKVMVAGGTDGTTIAGQHCSTEIFDPGTNTWTVVGNMSCRREFAGYVKLPSGAVVAAGGVGRIASLQFSSNANLDTVELFNPLNRRWSRLGNLTEAKGRCFMTYIPDANNVLITGYNGVSSSTRSEYMDVSTFLLIKEPSIMSAPNRPVDMVLMDDNSVFMPVEALLSPQVFSYYSSVYGSGHLNDVYSIDTIVNPTTITVQSVPGRAVNISPTAVATVVTAPDPDGRVGPNVLVPTDFRAVSSINTTTTAELTEGRQYANLSVADATQFPNKPGWLSVAFGRSTEASPIRYLGVRDATTITLDFNYKFAVTNPAGASVTLLVDKSAHPIGPDHHPHMFLTDSASGRVAAVNIVEEIVASGVNLDVEIVYPGDYGLGRGDKVVVWAGNLIDQEVEEARAKGII